MLVWLLAYLAIDLVAYRCGWFSAECRTNHGWLSAVVDWASLSPKLLWFELTPGVGKLLALATLVPIGILMAIRLVSGASFRNYEEFSIEGTGGTEVNAGPSDVGLRSPYFWKSERAVSRLRQIHLAAGLAAAQLALAGALHGVAAEGASDEVRQLALRLLFIGLIPLAVTFGIASHPAIFRRDITKQGARDLIPKVNLIGSAALLAITMIAAWQTTNFLPVDASVCGDACPRSIQPIATLVRMSYVLSATQAILVTLLLGQARGQRWWWRFLVNLVLALAFVVLVILPILDARTSWLDDGAFLADLSTTFGASLGSYGPAIAAAFILLIHMVLRKRFSRGKAMLGLASSGLCALAGFMWGALWAGGGAWVADLLDGDGDLVRLEEPVWFAWIATSFAVLIVACLLAFIVLYRLKGRKSDVGKAITMFELNEGIPEGDTGIKRISNAFRWRRIVPVGDRALAVVEILTLALALFQITLYLTTGKSVGGFWLTMANTIVLSLPLVLIFGVRWAFTSAAGRRGVGSIWDVLTFFPRTFHPFAPPCYGDRAVPQLAYRIGRLTSEAEGETLPTQSEEASHGTGELTAPGVVVKAHSQGTVVTLAAILQTLADAERQAASAGPNTGLETSFRRERFRLVTFGSPLTVLYARIFPAYFADLVGWLAVQLGGTRAEPRWVHFRTPTDPLGTRLFTYRDANDPKGGPYQGPFSGADEVDPITDPAQWDKIEGEEAPPMGGHSTYWSHRVVDLRTATLCAQLSGDVELRKAIRVHEKRNGTAAKGRP